MLDAAGDPSGPGGGGGSGEGGWEGVKDVGEGETTVRGLVVRGGGGHYGKEGRMFMAG